MPNPIKMPEPDTLSPAELSSVITKLLGIQEAWVAEFEQLSPDHPEYKEVEFLVGWVHQSREILRRKLDAKMPGTA